ncbi:MAG: hypothetical protein H7319_21145 [Spirosoma sp.]|nr:hypothetical protein [Spirosoma sp.]
MDQDSPLKKSGKRQQQEALLEELNENAFNLLVGLYKARMFEVCFLNDRANPKKLTGKGVRPAVND